MDSITFPTEMQHLSMNALDEDSLRFPLTADRFSFESALAAFLEVDHVTALEVGSLGGMLVAEALQLGPKDHVVLSPFTPASIVKSLAATGVKATIVDTEPLNPILDLTKLPRVIGRKTRAIFVPHAGGFVEPMNELLDIALERQTILVEIPNSMFGGQFLSYRIGSLGHITILDFATIPAFAGLTGGAVATNVDTFALRAHNGISHIDAFMGDFHANLATGRLAQFSGLQTNLREVTRTYQSEFSRIIHGQTPRETGAEGYYLRIDTDVLDETPSVPERGFATSFLQCPIQTYPEFQKAFRWKPDCAPNSERWYRRALPLPLDPSMTASDARSIAQAVRERLHG